MSQPATSLLNQRSSEWRSRLGVLVAGLLVYRFVDLTKWQFVDTAGGMPPGHSTQALASS